MPYPWAQWQIDLLREQYGKMNTNKLAEKIGKSPSAVIQYAFKHGISAGRYWTEEDERFLIAKSGVLSYARIAKILGKTTRQVTSKVQKMNLGSFLDNTEHLHLSAVSELVGKDNGTIMKTWVKNGLKYRSRGKYKMFVEDNLLEWMQTHPEFWDATKCDYYFFQRFDWFKEKLLADREKNHRKRWKDAV